MISPSRLALAALVVAAAASCRPITACACTPPIPGAVLYGYVTDEGGAAVEGARVRAMIGDLECEGNVVEMGGGESGADGRYRFPIWMYGMTPGDCLAARAEAPAESGLADSALRRFAVNFHFGDAFVDSARVDLVLPPAGQ